MIKLFSKLKRDKLFFGLVLSTFICALFDIFIVVFDAVQIVAVNSNAAKLSGAFLGLNIVAIILTFLCLLYAVVYTVLKKRKIYAVIPKN